MEKRQEVREIRIDPKKIIAEIIIALVYSALTALIGIIKDFDIVITVRNCIISCALVLTLGHMYRQEYIYEDLQYSNMRHYYRFWVCFAICGAVSFVLVFVPPLGWPFLGMFVGLCLFSDSLCACAGGTMLLFVTALNAGCDMTVVAAYLIAGCLAVSLYKHIDETFKVYIPTVLTLVCLSLLLLAVSFIQLKRTLTFTDVVIPGINVVVTGLLVIWILRMFSGRVVFCDRDRLLELNDTENPLLMELKNTSQRAYYISIHTAYFCERVAMACGLDSDVLKCAAYYHKLAKDTSFMEEN
ncbi:MAG: hypothetical protein K6F84_09130, partial [Lachnospiraceae bacterium]|nr:hypothetical protein [Lachnospiraceae bacterium]